MTSKESPSRIEIRARALVPAGAAVLIACWLAWWVQSLRQDSLVLGVRTWVPTLPFLAGDFRVHIDHVTRLYTSGVNPYLQADDWVCAAFPYPPMVLRLFFWLSFVSTAAATRIWLTALAVIFALGAFGAWRTRRDLGLAPVSLVLVTAAVLYSTPVLMALERGQCDPLVIPALLVAAGLLRRQAPWPETVAGALLGASAWLKYYPGAAAVGLLACRRPRALAAFVAVVGLVGVVDRHEIQRAIENGQAIAQLVPRRHPIHPLRHSIVEDWSSLGLVRRSRPLRQIPPPLAAACLLVPAVAVLGRRLARTPAAHHGPLIFPMFLWLTAAATYAMPYSNDYNLTTLPLAALCVWDRRDPWSVHLGMLLLVLWWQPLALPVPGEAVFLIKLAALYAVGLSLMGRIGEAVAAVATAGARRPDILRGMHRRLALGAPRGGPS
jgi:hypothetical protein